jgi:hypothetical protein
VQGFRSIVFLGLCPGWGGNLLLEAEIGSLAARWPKRLRLMGHSAIYWRDIAFIGAPGVTRTPDTRFRKPPLYPPELQGHGGNLAQSPVPEAILAIDRLADLPPLRLHPSPSALLDLHGSRPKLLDTAIETVRDEDVAVRVDGNPSRETELTVTCAKCAESRSCSAIDDAQHQGEPRAVVEDQGLLPAVCRARAARI